MDFGAGGLEGLMGPEGGGGASSKVSNPETKPNGLGSGLVKQEKSGPPEDDWKSSKIAKSESLSAYKTMPLHQATPLLRSNAFSTADTRQQEHMLSFSSVKPEVPFLRKDGGLVEKSTHNSVFPYYHRTPSAYTRNVGNQYYLCNLFCFFFFFSPGGVGCKACESTLVCGNVTLKE